MLKTLLLADDSVVIQKLVGLSFANEDVELVTTDNGDDAVTRARELKPDLVLADVVMPGKSGYEVCEAIKQDPELRSTPVLLLTGTFEAFDEDRAGAAGADGHITKPFEAQALVERVNQLLAENAAAPPAADPVGTAASPVATPVGDDAADAFDFFDDEAESRAAPAPPTATSMPAPSLETDTTDDLGFGDAPSASLEPLDALVDDSPALATELEPLPDSAGDHTVAFMPDAPYPNATPEVANLDTGTSGFEIGGGEGDAPLSGPSDDLAAIADDSFGSQNTAPLGGAPEADADPAATMIADDLFDSGPTDPNPGNPLVDGPDDGGFEFSFGGTDAQAPPDLDVGDSLGEDLAQVDPSGVSAYDVSSSDLGDPFTAPPVPVVEPIPMVEPIDAGPVLEAAPAPSATEHDADWPSETATPAPAPAAGAAPDISPVMRERIQETLEKVAWEAFADLSDKVVKEVLQRVEAVAWEVIPQMAETLVQEEIRKMKGDDGKQSD